VENIELVQADTRHLVSSLRTRFDVVVMNPPFGTKHNKGDQQKEYMYTPLDES
jgi:tRNA1(Val) A37 N6-methylase TrmN6